MRFVYVLYMFWNFLLSSSTDDLKLDILMIGINWSISKFFFYLEQKLREKVSSDLNDPKPEDIDYGWRQIWGIIKTCSALNQA